MNKRELEKKLKLATAHAKYLKTKIAEMQRFKDVDGHMGWFLRQQTEANKQIREIEGKLKDLENAKTIR